MKLYLGADHRGYSLKEKVKGWLDSLQFTYEDLGAHQLDPDDDYTTYAGRVGSAVGTEKNALGILLCGSGAGVEITANKFDGARAALGKTPLQVAAARHDDNINILVIAADFTKDLEAKEMIKNFLDTNFAHDIERYARRLEDIKRIEENN